MMCSTLAVESVLRISASNDSQQASTVTSTTSFKNVTGQFDTSKLMESYFNTGVLKSEEQAPVYETRTVMVTLSGENLTARSGGEAVTDYIRSEEGQKAAKKISAEQNSFLKALSKKGISYSLEHTYNTVLNAVAIEIDTKHVSAIKKMDGVESVVITTSYSEPKTVQSAGGVVTNETSVYETGIYDSKEFLAEYGKGMVQDSNVLLFR